MPLAFVAGLLVVGASITTILLTAGVPIAAGYLTLMAVLSSSLGLLIRRAIPAAAILLVYLLILSPLLQGQNWYFLPDIASHTLWFASTPDTSPPAIVAWSILLAWTLAFLIASTLIAKRRDT